MNDFVFTKEQVQHLLETQVKKEILILGTVLLFIGFAIGGMTAILFGYDTVREYQAENIIVTEHSKREMIYAISLQKKYKELIDENGN